MHRRHFLTGLAAAALVGCSSSPTEAAPPPPFRPTRFSVEVRGTGPDVILIPGLTAGRGIWSRLVEAVPGYRYHLLQVSGFAGEPARGNASGPVVGPLAEEIGRYIEAEGLRRPAVIGHSMGGTLAMMVASKWPERVGKLMVVDIPPQPSGLLGSDAARMRGLADSLRDFASTPTGRQIFESVIGGMSGEGTRPSDPDVVARAMHELATLDLTADLPRITAPMTVVYASLDARSNARQDAAYRAAFARAREPELIRIDRSGHMIMLDQPARFAETVRGFLSR
jgi:pimeloyl-ACP methyl ester carboxylesterase